MEFLSSIDVDDIDGIDERVLGIKPESIVTSERGLARDTYALLKRMDHTDHASIET